MIKIILVVLVALFVVRALTRRRKPPVLLTEIHPEEFKNEERESLRSGEP